MRREPGLDRVSLGAKLLQWHSGMDHIYAVGSFYIGGKVYPDIKIVRSAIGLLDTELSKTNRMLNGEKVRSKTFHGYTDNLKKFAGFNKKELRERKEELEELLYHLEQYLVFDYA